MKIKALVMITLLALLAAIALPMASPASTQAATTYEFYDSFNMEVGIDSSDAWLAQTFTTSSSHTVTKVDLHLKRDGSPGTITISIKATDAGGHPTGPDLTSTSISDTSISETAGWVPIALAPYVLAQGAEYAIVVRASTPGTLNELWWSGDSDENYANGNGLESSNSGDNWGSAYVDFAFAVSGNPAVGMNTGLQSPSANYYIGFDSFWYPYYAYDDGGSIPAKGQHGWMQVYHNYNLPVPSGARIDGIEVRTDALRTNLPQCTWGKFRVFLSWNAGLNWTSYYETPGLTTSEVTHILGGTANTWGRTWDYTEFSNANFRVKIIPQTDCWCFLDWIPVIVYYTYEEQPDLTLDRTSIDFGSIDCLSSSSPETVTVTNDGTADLVIDTISITGTDSDQFSKQNDNCSGQTLAPAASATLEVVFSPTSSGAKSATLSIPSNDPGEPTVDVPLGGTGIATLPTADFSATPISGDEPLMVSFTDTSTSVDGITSWLWDFGDGQTSMEQSPTHQYAEDGIYTVSLTITDADGDSNTETKTGYIIVIEVLAQQTISPDNAATVNSEDEQIIIEFPASSVADEAVVTIREESQTGAPTTPSGFKAGATCFSIDLTADLVPGTMVTITVKYSDDDLEACDGDPNKLTLSRYDEDTGEWVILTTTVDTEAMTLTASTDQFSTWMIMVSESSAKGTALWIWLVAVFGGLGVILAISSAVIITRRRLA